MSDNNEQSSCDDKCMDDFFSEMKDQVLEMYSLIYQEKRPTSEKEKRRIKLWFRDAQSQMRGWSWESRAKIVNGKVHDYYAHSHVVVGVLGNDIDYYLDAAGVLFWWGQYVWKKGSKREGIRTMLRAAHCLGAWKGAIDQLERKEMRGALSEVRSEAGKKGAKSKSLSSESVKKEFLSLIEKKMPAGGWKNRAQAVKDVRPDLSLFIADQKLNFDPDNLERLIGDWCRNKKSPEFGRKVNEMLKMSGV
ncbi:hypothetical protein [Rahnella laticis]|uniref:hypothetical protein n=1 Tax=Rahnella laticis TaxID=2787622 RepID=UPI0018A2803F|nr:hypothetical protein [Rahnella laticis]MBF7994313.1 hypothetical protein [Rahnella laticis]